MNDHEQPDWDDWVQRLMAGDRDAVEAFWVTYGQRLRRLADKQVKFSLKRRFDADDVVQSACRTFFRRARDGQFDVGNAKQLWGLLSAITLTKVRQQARYHQRGKRDISREQPMVAAADSGQGVDWPVLAQEPTPDEMAAFADEFERILRALTEEQQQIVQLKLDDYSNNDIAAELGISERTVRRMIVRVQERCSELLR